MATAAILAIDQGTSNSKAVLVNMSGQPIARGQCAMKCLYPTAGWVEQSGEEIWQTVLTAISRCLDGHDDIEIIAIGISSQRESALAWDAETSDLLGPCISWQCRRSQSLCRSLEERGLKQRIQELSGLPLDPLFSAGKFRWLIDQIDPALDRSRIRLGTVDTWLLWNLTGGRQHLTDSSNASRTQLCDIFKGQWSDELARYFGVPPSCLPKIKHSAADFGTTADRLGVLKPGIPILAMMGDSHAALYAQGGTDSRVIKATYGTGSSVMTTTGKMPINASGLATTIAWETKQGRAYALEGNITVSAAVLPWVARLVGLEGSVDRLAELAQQADPRGCEMLVPAMVGLGAPRWIGGLHGLMDGLTFNTGQAEIARAAFDSIIFQVRDVVEAMRVAGRANGLPELTSLRADGGASVNAWLMQRQADTLNISVQRASQAELSAVGIALMAGYQLGLWDEISSDSQLLPSSDECSPIDSRDSDQRYQHWLQAVERTLFHCPQTPREAP